MREWLCIDVGFTNTRIAVGRSGSLDAIDQRRSIDVWSDRRLAHLVRRDRWIEWLGEQIAPMVTSRPAIDHIGLCIPGPVERTGTISAANSLWGAASGPLTPDDLERAWGRPVTVVNDIVATAVRYGADASLGDAETVLVVNVGSGIGSKLYDRRTGTVMLGRDGLDGEIGFTVVEEGEDAAQTLDGTLCGTLGLYASGSGFARMLRQTAQDDPDAFGRSLLTERLGPDIDDVDRVALNAAALEVMALGDAFTLAVLRRAIGYLAKALHGVLLFAAPDRLVIAGGFATGIGEPYREMLRDALEPLLRPMHSAARIDGMISLGQSDGMDNLQGLARILERKAGITHGR